MADPRFPTKNRVSPGSRGGEPAAAPILSRRIFGQLVFFTLLLLSIGDVGGAEQALTEVVRREHIADNLANAKIELMNCASFRRDRVSFERWRERAFSHSDVAPPNIRADYHLKVGIGFARFGNYSRAKQELGRALDIATAHGLPEFVFKIERLSENLGECGSHEGIESGSSEAAEVTEALREVSASLAALGTVD